MYVYTHTIIFFLMDISLCFCRSSQPSSLEVCTISNECFVVPSSYHKLSEAIRETLSAAILMGGTTLRDFVNSDGKPGYFAQSLLVYGRGGNPCPECATTLKEIRMNNRSTVYCPRCQR